MSLVGASSATLETQFQSGGLRVAGLLEPRAKADRLTVVLNAYCARESRTPPVFAEWPESSDTFGHILRISDPSLFLSDWINASCFLGTEADDPIPAVVKYSKQVAHQLGVSENRVVYFGHSGAGFGAIQCAVYDRASSGLAVNPILEPEQYAKYNFAKSMATIFRPNSQFQELYKDYPQRFSVTNAVKSARAAGLKPCLGIIQNVLDTHHYGKHFIPFCKSVGIGPFGGVDGTGLIQGTTCILRGGHSAFPKDGLTESLFLKLLFRRSHI
jgi:hypothetical protein